MRLKSVRQSTAVALLAVVAMGASACAPLRSHQGYVVDADLVNSVQAGTDTRQSVLAVLGKPTFTSEFNQGDWYYISRDSRNFAYNNPRVRDQMTLRISFDQKGVVTAVRRSGVEQVASISPSSKTTPTLGKKRSFFDELFGNIGTVGAVGGGAQGGNTNTGGGRDTP
ncbi:outer membrane protein assembly factor BamE [Sphingomonas sp. HMWF008]|nr:outer membrane protein assembly factor BamE [Sphingomonas sp. HMWF008]